MVNNKKKRDNKDKIAFDAPRGSVFMIDPESLVLVDDKEHPLYDPRVNADLNPSFVKNVTVRGVIKPVIIRKEGDKAIVIDGRQRVRAAREANKKINAEGGVTLRIPCIIKRTDDDTAASMMVELNEHRVADGLVTKAFKAQRLLNRGLSNEAVADSFGVSTSTLRNWLLLADCHPKVRAAVEDGRVRLADATRELAKLPHNEQVAQLEKLMAENPTRKTLKNTGEKRPGKITVNAKIKKLVENDALLGEQARVIVQWLAGKASDGDLIEACPRLSKALES